MDGRDYPRMDARNALDVAIYFAEYSGYTKTNLQVMKLTYISHGYMLAIHDTPLICDEVEAWDHGPVIPAIWHELKKWGSRIIERVRYTPSPFNGEQREIMDTVFQHYGRFCGYYLSQITHEDGDNRVTPWAQCYQKGRNNVIPDRITDQYYKKLLAEV